MLASKHKCVWSLLVQGFTIFLGILILCWSTKTVDVLLDQVLIIKPGSAIFEEWKNPAQVVVIDVYVFNWTNPDDFKNKSVKPKFKELGPYVVDQKYHKVDVTFNLNNTITYRNNKTFQFDRLKSVGTPEDNITFPNIIPIVAVHKAKSWNYFMRKGLSIALHTVNYHQVSTVSKLLFNGYDDPFLDTAKYLPFLDDVPNMDKFAWFYNRNGSADYEGIYHMGTGIGNTTIGKLYKWNYKTSGPYPGRCSSIQYPLEIFPRGYKKDKLEFFFADFCRIITLEFKESITYAGIEAYNYTGEASFIDSGAIDPENTCLCTNNCQKFGVVDFSICKYGAPVYMSYPHFLKADPSFVNAIEGLEPDVKKHEMFMIIHPLTGIVLELSMAVQVNILAEPNPAISKYSDVPKIIFPAFWFRVKSKISYKMLVQLFAVTWMPAILITFGAIILLLGSVFFIRNFNHLVRDSRKEEEKYKRKIKEELKPLNDKGYFERI